MWPHETLDGPAAGGDDCRGKQSVSWLEEERRWRPITAALHVAHRWSREAKRRGWREGGSVGREEGGVRKNRIRPCVPANRGLFFLSTKYFANCWRQS